MTLSFRKTEKIYWVNGHQLRYITENNTQKIWHSFTGSISNLAIMITTLGAKPTGLHIYRLEK